MFRTAAIQSLRRAHNAATNHLQVHGHSKSDEQLVRGVASIATQTRSLVTAAQKRSLNKEQIGGKDAKPKPSPPVKSPTSSSSGSASGGSSSGSPPPPPPSTGGGSGGSPIVPLVAFSAAAAGGAYYMDLMPMEGLKNLISKEDKEDKPVTVVEEVVADQKLDGNGNVDEKKDVEVETETEATEVKKEEDKVSESSVGNGNRVVSIQAPPSSGRSKADPPSPVQHNPDGNRVSVEKFANIYGSSSSNETPEESKEVKSIPSTASVAAAAQEELTTSVTLTSTRIDDALQQAHATMRATLNDSFLKDLDKLGESELRIRIIQLASEMGERTKWEAVRLREFLSMKEKEVADNFHDLMQKQRHEFEDLLARRLREQEYQLTKEANNAIDAMDKAIESVIDAATSAQQAEHDAALKSTEERLERELNAKYEADFGNKLAKAKAEFINELQEKISTIEKLSQRLEKNEQNLEISRNFESGSQRAHRVSAAALVLAEKMETSKGAMEEFAALKAIATENGVIGSALNKIPNSFKAGIPTLAELQASFEQSHEKTRQAAYVPSGQSGVEGQLVGMIFASLTGQPSPDTLPPAELDSGKMSDLILARAKKHVKLGQLQEAVNELDKLKGQAAFTINDWKVAAMDRIAVDQTLKVIKLECALMNKNMAG